MNITPGARQALMAAALVLIALLAFSNSFDGGFVLDGKGLLRDPRIVQVTAHNLALIFQHSYWWPSGESGLYRPFTSLTYLLNYAILGNQDQPAGYHWLNFLLHACNAVLVYFMMLRLVRQFWISAFIAAVWAVHPVLTESVTNIVGRADLLAGLATLGGFLLYLKSTETSGGTRVAWLAGLMTLTFIGVFSKESAVCIAGVIALYELTWREGKRLKPLLLGLAATFPAIAVMLYQRSTVLAASLPAEFPFTDNPIVGAGFWTGRLTAIGVMARYLGLVVWPARLSCDYSYAAIPLARGTLADWLSWAFLLLAIVLIASLYWRNRTAFFLGSFAAVTFLPMSNLFFPIGSIMAERFLYLPSIGLLACLVMAIDAASLRAGLARSTPFILGLILIVLAIRTRERNNDWQNDFSIVTGSMGASPNSFKLHRQLAELLFGADRTSENIARGREEVEKSVAILDTLPDSYKSADAYCLSGGYYLIAGDQLSKQDSDGRIQVSPAGMREYQKGIQVLLKCAAIDKAVRAAYVKENEATRRLANTALIPASGDPQPYLMLGVAYLRLSDVARAIEAAKQALALHPRSAAGYRQITNVFMLKDQKEDAAVALTKTHQVRRTARSCRLPVAHRSILNANRFASLSAWLRRRLSRHGWKLDVRILPNSSGAAFSKTMGV